MHSIELPIDGLQVPDKTLTLYKSCYYPFVSRLSARELFAANLKRLIGSTAEDAFARLYGLKQSNINRFTRAIGDARLISIDEIAQKTGVKLKEFFMEPDERAPEPLTLDTGNQVIDTRLRQLPLPLREYVLAQLRFAERLQRNMPPALAQVLSVPTDETAFEFEKALRASAYSKSENESV